MKSQETRIPLEQQPLQPPPPPPQRPLQQQFSYLTYFILFMLGVGMLFPWNIFITNKSYIKLRLNGSSYSDNFSNFFSLGFMSSNVLMLIYLQIFNTSNINHIWKRMIFSLFINGFVFFICLLFTFITNINSYFFFYLNMIMVVVCGCSTAFLQNSVFGLTAAMFSGVYMQAVMSGQGLAGALVAISQISSTFILPSVPTEEEEIKSAVLYFIFALVVIAVSLAGGIYLPRVRLYRAYVEKGDEVEEEEEALEEEDEEKFLDTQQIKTTPLSSPATPSQRFISVLTKIWPMTLSVFITFFVTLSLFPSILSLVQSTISEEEDSDAALRWKNVLFVPTAFLVFALSDWLGKSMPGFPPLFGMVRFDKPRNPFTILVLSTLRLVFIPMFLTSNVVVSNPITGEPLERVFPLWVGDDVLFLVVVFAFGVSNGWISSLAMMYAPELVTTSASSGSYELISTSDEEVGREKQVAGTTMVFCLTIGLACGSMMSFGYRSMLCGGCNPFVQ